MALVALDVRAVEPSDDREKRTAKDTRCSHEPLSRTAQHGHGNQQSYGAADGDDSPRLVTCRSVSVTQTQARGITATRAVRVPSRMDWVVSPPLLFRHEYGEPAHAGEGES